MVFERVTNIDVTADHWHVAGYWSDDADGEGIALEFWDAISDLGDRAEYLSDYLLETAEIRADQEDFRDAWETMKRGEKLGILHEGLTRLWNTHNGIGDIAPAYLDMTTREPQLIWSALWTIGIEPGHNGQYQDSLDTLEIWQCSDPECLTPEQWQEEEDKSWS